MWHALLGSKEILISQTKCSKLFLTIYGLSRSSLISYQVLSGSKIWSCHKSLFFNRPLFGQTTYSTVFLPNMVLSEVPHNNNNNNNNNNNFIFFRQDNVNYIDTIYIACSATLYVMLQNLFEYSIVKSKEG